MWQISTVALLSWLSQIALFPAAQAQDATAGEVLAKKYCARCHAIGSAGRSPLPGATPFPELVERYDPDVLAEALGEGIVVGHPSMPEFVYEPEAIGGLVAYLQTLVSPDVR